MNFLIEGSKHLLPSSSDKAGGTMA